MSFLSDSKVLLRCLFAIFRYDFAGTLAIGLGCSVKLDFDPGTLKTICIEKYLTLKYFYP